MMSLIEWKKVEAEVKFLCTLPLCTFLAAHNRQIMICEANRIMFIHTNETYKNNSTHRYAHAHIHMYTQTHALVYDYMDMRVHT